MMSGCGTSANEALALRVRTPDSSVTSRGRSARKMVVAPGSWTSTWKGPTASRAVKRSNSAMAISMTLLFVVFVVGFLAGCADGGGGAGRAEAAAVLGRADAEGADEGAAHRL